MRTERRTNSVFIAHNNLAIFTNRISQDEYLIRVNKGLHGLTEDPNDNIQKPTQWITLGEMKVTASELKEYLKLLTELST